MLSAHNTRADAERAARLAAGFDPRAPYREIAGCFAGPYRICTVRPGRCGWEVHQVSEAEFEQRVRGQALAAAEDHDRLAREYLSYAADPDRTPYWRSYWGSQAIRQEALAREARERAAIGRGVIDVEGVAVESARSVA